MDPFVQRYRDVINGNGLSIAEIAQYSKLSPTAIINSCREDSKTSYEHANRVAECLGYVPLIWLTDQKMTDRYAVSRLWGGNVDHFPSEIIRAHRDFREISVVQLAEACDLSPRDIRNYESGNKTPSMQELGAIGTVLQAEVCYFVRRPESLGDRLENLRKETGMSAHQIALHCGLRHNLVYRITPDTRNSVTLTNLEKIARAHELLPLVFYHENGWPDQNMLVDDPCYVAHRLIWRREHLKLTPEALARRAGVNHSTIENIESRSRESYLRTIENVAGVMGLIPQYLVPQESRAQILRYPSVGKKAL